MINEISYIVLQCLYMRNRSIRDAIISSSVLVQSECVMILYMEKDVGFEENIIIIPLGLKHKFWNIPTSVGKNIDWKPRYTNERLLKVV